MTGQTRLANQALDLIHAENIGDINERGRVAQLVRDHIDSAIELVCRKGAYSSVTTMTCLTEICLDKTCCTLPPPFQNAYPLPGGACKFLKAVAIEGCNCTCEDRIGECKSQTHYPWRRFQVQIDKDRKCDAIIICQSGGLNLEYVFKPDNLDALPEDVRQVIIHALAHFLAPRLTADRGMGNDMLQKMKLLEGEAMKADNTEHRQEYEFTTSANFLARSSV